MAYTDGFVQSYLYLRRAIGVVGLLLPLALWLVLLGVSGPGIPGSISGFYYTAARDVLVGALCAIGVFLLAYRFDSADADHQGDRISDNLLTNLAGACAVGVALFPTNPPGVPGTWVSVVHVISAGGLFALLAFLSLFRFTRPDPGVSLQDPAKRRRNVVYRICGAVIAVLLVVAVLDGVFGSGLAAPMDRLYWEETVMVLAFGISWLVKGHALQPPPVDGSDEAGAATDTPANA